MKKLNQDELKEKWDLLKQGGGYVGEAINKEIIENIINLDINEALEISRAEWVGKQRYIACVIRNFIKRNKPEMKISIRQFIDGTGWIIVRTK